MNQTILPKSWNVPEAICLRMGQGVGRQRLLSEGEHHMLVLHQIPLEDDRGLRKPALFWIDEREEWKSFPEAGGRSALRNLVQGYYDRVMELSDMMERIDGNETPEEVHYIIDLGNPILRAVRNLNSVLLPFRRIMNDDRELLEIRDLAASAELMMDLLVTDAKSTSDYLIARHAMTNADEAKKATGEARKLSLLAALFFPLVTISSFFGMNPPTDVMANSGLQILMIGLALGSVLLIGVNMRK